MDKKILIQLLEMCSNIDFSIEEAEDIIKQVDINEPFVSTYGMKTTFLSKAVEYFNVRMVELLLKNGANPNLSVDGENVLWDLQYREYPDDELYLIDGCCYCSNDERIEKYDRIRLNIVKLLLDYGANPNINPEGDGYESLIPYVCYKVFNEIDDHNWYYIVQFFTLLIIYGGHCDYIQPKVYKPFDLDRVWDYRFSFKEHADGYHLSGEIYDKNEKGEVVAEI